MSRLFTAFAVTALVAGCDSKNPFMLEATSEVTGEVEVLEPNDPNTDINNRYAYDTAQNLTMNSVQLDDNGTPNDTSDDQLIINNLPFDGPDGRYLQNEVLANGAEVYRSQQTQTTGTTLTYAVFIRSDYLEATSAASGQWNGYGYSGANINRESFNLPGGIGEYIYRGNYAGTRTFSDRGGIEIVSGDLEMRLDVLDFDPVEGFQGAIDGNVTNRTREGTAGTLGLGDLPPIYIEVSTFNSQTGVWEGQGAATFLTNGDVRSTGTSDGMIGGPNGQEMGGYSIITGAADVQRVTYQVVRYQPPVIDPLTGVQALDPVTGDPVFGPPELASGFDNVSLEALQNQINARQNIVDDLRAVGIPPNSRIISDETLFRDFTTEYDAREIGVFIGDQVIPIP